MKDAPLVFDGFGEGMFKFFKDLGKNNNAAWFAKNKERYQRDVVYPAKAFVTEMAPFFNRLNPSIRTEPKFNETLMRINKDMRFAKGDPYRTFLLIHFGRFKMDSEFFVFITPETVEAGLFINGSKGDKLFFGNNKEKFKQKITSICGDFNIDGKYDLYGYKKDQYKIRGKFRAAKHYDDLSGIDMFMLQKSYSPESRKARAGDMVLEAVKLFSNLYPLYCFAVSPDPLKLIDDFENNFGILQ